MVNQEWEKCEECGQPAPMLFAKASLDKDFKPVQKMVCAKCSTYRRE